MAKKISKKSKLRRSPATPRMTTTRLTIIEGEAYVRRYERRLKATRTMRDVAGLKKEKTRAQKVVNKSKAQKIVKKASPAPKRAVRKSPTAPAKTSKISKNVGRGFPKAAPPPVMAPMRTGSRLSNKSNKVAKFKTSSRDDLQIPAFGFIDVCFCLDTTGSMGCEIEQTKHVIEAIIHNI